MLFFSQSFRLKWVRSSQGRSNGIVNLEDKSALVKFFEGLTHGLEQKRYQGFLDASWLSLLFQSDYPDGGDGKRT